MEIDSLKYVLDSYDMHSILFIAVEWNEKEV